MKRILSTFVIAFTITGITTGQSEFDALKFIQPEINGTARYMSMAGAFGALGGDASSIKDNPAGLGIYRKSELTVGFSALTQNATTSWRNANKTIEGFYTPAFNNVTGVLSFPVYSSNTNLVRSNFSFSFNRLKNFDKTVRINGGNGSPSSLTDYFAYFSHKIPANDLYKTDKYNPYDNITVPWLSVIAANAGLIKEDNPAEHNWVSVLMADETVSPYYTGREQGYLNEYAVAWSGNYNNRFFLGAALNFYELNYSSVTEYKETFSYDGYLSLLNTFKSAATGINFKFGSIYALADFLRLGFSIQTPTVFLVEDSNRANLKYGYNTTSSGFINDKEISPEGTNHYQLQGPFSHNISGSFIFGKKGLIGVEYITTYNPMTKFMDTEGNSNLDYVFQNDSIKSLFSIQNMLKIGLEYKLTDNISIRGGYAYSDPATLSRLGKEFNTNSIRTDTDYFVQKGNTQYWSAGIGYRESFWFIDLALLKKEYNERFYAYNYSKLNPDKIIEPAKVNISNFNIVATIGLRF